MDKLPVSEECKIIHCMTVKKGPKGSLKDSSEAMKDYQHYFESLFQPHERTMAEPPKTIPYTLHHPNTF
jgi:hypothetical protein